MHLLINKEILVTLHLNGLILGPGEDGEFVVFVEFGFKKSDGEALCEGTQTLSQRWSMPI